MVTDHTGHKIHGIYTYIFIRHYNCYMMLCKKRSRLHSPCKVHNAPLGLHSLRPISQIPQCIRQISHNALICNRNVQIYPYFCYKVVHCGIWDWCTVLFVRQVIQIKLLWNRSSNQTSRNTCIICMFFICSIVLKFCTVPGRDTVVFRAEFQSDQADEADIKENRISCRSEMKIS